MAFRHFRHQALNSRRQGASAIIDKGPHEFSDYIKSETEKWGKVMKALGAKAE